LREPFVQGPREIFVGASVGVAFNTPTSTADQLLRNADLAMYTAKRRGKGSYVIYEAEMHVAAVDRLQTEADLRRGLTKGEFHNHYQPIVEFASRLIDGVEALVRWYHAVWGPLAHAGFRS